MKGSTYLVEKLELLADFLGDFSHTVDRVSLGQIVQQLSAEVDFLLCQAGELLQGVFIFHCSMVGSTLESRDEDNQFRIY